MFIKTLLNTAVIIGLMIGAIIYQGRLVKSTTELDAIKNGVGTIVMGMYLIGACILVKMHDKD